MDCSKDKQELTEYLMKIQTYDCEAGQDTETLRKYLIQLTNWMGRANELMASYGRLFREEKKAAYLKVFTSLESIGKTQAPSLVKDYVDSRCVESGEMYDLSERCSRSCVHTIEAIRSVLSSLKDEQRYLQH